MDTGRALQRAITADPEADLPRLVYADWLDEQSVSAGPSLRWWQRWARAHTASTWQARAEFIRLEVNAAGMPADDARKPAFETRAQALLAKYRREWERPLREAYGQGLGRVEWHRGFVRAVEVTAESLLAEQAGVITQNPVETLRVISLRRGHIPALARYPHLSRITTLDLVGMPLEEVDVWALAAASIPVNLRVLRVGQGRVDDAARIVSVIPAVRHQAIRTKSPPPLPSIERINELDLSMWFPCMDTEYDFTRNVWMRRNRSRGSASSPLGS